MAAQQRTPDAERVAQRRKALRTQGLRPRVIWLADLRDEAVREQIRRETLAIAASARNDEDIAFAQAIQYWPEDDPD